MVRLFSNYAFLQNFRTRSIIVQVLNTVLVPTFQVLIGERWLKKLLLLCDFRCLLLLQKLFLPVPAEFFKSNRLFLYAEQS